MSGLRWPTISGVGALAVDHRSATIPKGYLGWTFSGSHDVAPWGSRDSFNVNTIAEPCHRKGHPRSNWEAVASGSLYGSALYAPEGKEGDLLVQLLILMRCPRPVPYPTIVPYNLSFTGQLNE